MSANWSTKFIKTLLTKVVVYLYTREGIMRFLLLLLSLLSLCLFSACKEKENPIVSDPDLASQFSVLSVDYTPRTDIFNNSGVNARVSFIKWGNSIPVDTRINVWVTLITPQNERFEGVASLNGVQGGGEITRINVFVLDITVERIRLYEVAFTYSESSI